MAGIYIHIPFCKQACHYCDFHFSTNLKYTHDMAQALSAEIELRQSYLNNEPVSTIYFGGGTPSILKPDYIAEIINTINSNFEVDSHAEITLEANPDDISALHLEGWRHAGINRLSIGIQSFRDSDLQWMNRAHTAAEATTCVKAAQAKGFNNISIDLIYGLPDLDEAAWHDNVQQALALGVPHISAYCLTVEPKTALASFIKKGTARNVDEQQGARHFEILMHQMHKAGYEHYEISNFCRDQHYSKHNTSYWDGVSYMGIGPSAHSFDGTTRQWNASGNHAYIETVMKGDVPFESESLDNITRYNEYVMTTLRTQWGLDLLHVQAIWGHAWCDYLLREAKPYLALQELQLVNDTMLLLTDKGKYFADRIASDLFMTHEKDGLAMDSPISV